MNKFLILIVLYECKVKDSLSYTSLLKSSEYLSASKLILWDNSSSIQSIDDISCFQDIKYIHTPENISLSKIYNRVIQENEGYDYMIILDQDSSFTSDYFHKTEIAINTNPDINLYLPIVKSGFIIVSPGNYKVFKGSYWEKEKYGKIEVKNTLAINSGMIINFNYLKNIFKGYDERLKFYGTDTYFMFEYAKDNKYCYVIDYIFKHDSALLDDNENINKMLFRLHDLFYSWRITNENNKQNLIFINTYICLKILKLVLTEKKYAYLKLLKVFKND